MGFNFKRTNNKQTEVDKPKIIEFSSIQDDILKFNQKTLKDLIAPSGINASRFNELEIISRTSRFEFTIFYICFCFDTIFIYFFIINIISNKHN